MLKEIPPCFHKTIKFVINIQDLKKIYCFLFCFVFLFCWTPLRSGTWQREHAVLAQLLQACSDLLQVGSGSVSCLWLRFLLRSSPGVWCCCHWDFSGGVIFVDFKLARSSFVWRSWMPSRHPLFCWWILRAICPYWEICTLCYGIGAGCPTVQIGTYKVRSMSTLDSYFVYTYSVMLIVQ